MGARLIIGGVDVSEYISALSVSSQPYTAGANEKVFINYDGTSVIVGADGSVSTDISVKKTISVTLSKVPSELGAAIVSATEADLIDVSYSAPNSGSGIFCCTSCVSDCRKFALTWDIKITLESAAAQTAAGGGL